MTIHETEDEIELSASNHHRSVVVEKALDTDGDLAFSIVPMDGNGVTAYLGRDERKRLVRLLVELDSDLTLVERCSCGGDTDGHWFGGPECG